MRRRGRLQSVLVAFLPGISLQLRTLPCYLARPVELWSRWGTKYRRVRGLGVGLILLVQSCHPEVLQGEQAIVSRASRENRVPE